MQTDRQNILLIGSGRLARHLEHWNSLSEKPCFLLTWNRNQSTDLLNEYLNRSSVAWLAISDKSIVAFYDQYLASNGIKTVHFSGALHDSRIISAHPLMSFSQSLLPNDVYQKIHFALTGAATLQEVLPGFTNSFSILSEDNKAFYHAMCVMSGNFPQLLWNKISTELTALKIPESAFDLYLHQITENFILQKEKALTGPLVRKDFETIEKNLKSLDQSKLKKIYQSFIEVFSL